MTKTASTSGGAKMCGACGASFTCCAPDTCWCGAVTVDSDTLKRLSVTYPDCLCPACLAEAAKSEARSSV